MATRIPKTVVLFAAIGCFGIAGADVPTDSTYAHDREPAGVARAVETILPAIDHCITAHEALGGQQDLAMRIHFDVTPSGAIEGLAVGGLEGAVTNLPACVSGTVSALHFQAGQTRLRVEIPLFALSPAQTKTDS